MISQGNARDFAGVKAVHHPDMVSHMGGPQPIRGQPAHAGAMKVMIATFPDCHVDNLPNPGSGDWTTVITRTKGTFTGKMVLPSGKVIAPTGKAFDLDFTTTAKWDGDLLIEEFARDAARLRGGLL